jgi:LemA protein
MRPGSLLRDLGRAALVVLAGTLLTGISPSPAMALTDSNTLFLTPDAPAFNPQLHRIVFDPVAESSLTLRSGSTEVWVTDRTFSDGRFTPADHYQLQLGYKGLPCQLPRGGAPDCQVSITSGFCSGSCQVIDASSPRVVFPPYRFPADPFPNGSMSLAADSPELVMSGCPCHLYLALQTSAPGSRTWELRTGSSSQLILPYDIYSENVSSPLNELSRNARLQQLLGLGLAAAVLLVLIFLSYNRFISQRNLIRDSWADVDTELRRRYDLIPNLVQVVQGYSTYENSVLTSLAQARAAAMTAGSSPSERQAPESAITAGLRQVMAVGENNPQLRASPQFLLLQQQLAEAENRIQASRNIYNGNVRNYNTRVQSIPSNLIAAICGFREHAYFDIDPQQAAVPQVPGLNDGRAA